MREKIESFKKEKNSLINIDNITNNVSNDLKIAIFWASGYVWWELLEKLYNKTDYKIVAFARNLKKMEYLNKFNNKLKNKWAKVWLVNLALDEKNYNELLENLKWVDTVFYLVHSMGVDNYEERDRQLAELMSKLAKEAWVKQIIYLWWLWDKNDPNASLHIKSRLETADYLRKYHDNVTEIWAWIIIWAWSLSFELIDRLSRKLPLILRFDWEWKTNPVYIKDLVKVLLKSILNEEVYNKKVDIGDYIPVSYSDMLKIYRKEILYKNSKVITVNKKLFDFFNETWLISRIVSLITDTQRDLIDPLLKSLDTNAVINRSLYLRKINNEEIKFVSYVDAIKKAQKKEKEWKFEFKFNLPEEFSYLNPYSKSIDSISKNELLFLSKKYEIESLEQASKIFKLVKKFWTDKVWYFWYDFLWKWKTIFDKLLWAKTFGKRRKSEKYLKIRDRFDNFIVEDYKEFTSYKLLRLKTTYLIPGEWWLEFKVFKENERPVFEISFLFKWTKWKISNLYWNAVFPFHKFILWKMMKNIVELSK